MDIIFSNMKVLVGQDGPGVDTFQFWRGGKIDNWLEWKKIS